MATLPTNTGAVTLTDWAKTRNPDGSTASVIELLNQSNEVLQDMLWKEGNLPTGHRTTIRTGLPTPTWRKLYQGVQPSKSVRAQVDDACGMLEARNEVDCDLADLNGDASAFRLQEAQSEIEGMNQSLCRELFYGDQSINPERFTGLAARYSLKSAPNGQNIVDAGGTGADNTSVWLVIWSDVTVTGIYPKGSKAGLYHQDLGEIDAFDQQTPPARFRAYADLWKWKCGLSLRDWRYAVRIANIDVSDLIAQTGTQAPTAATALLKTMIDAMARIPNMGMGRAAFYCNRTVKAALAKAALDKSQNAVTVEPAINQFGTVTPGWAGNGTTRFLGVPIRTVDQLLSNEARVL